MKIGSIQVLRFLASIAIILYHTDTFGSHGYFGVDILFIISGYVIMKSTEIKRPHFLLRRFIRIIPLYWISTIFLYGILCLAPELSIMSEAAPGNLLKSMLFIPIKNTGGGYSAPLLAVGWTMNYEIYFYIIFFLCSLCSHKYRGLLCSAVICILCVLRCGIDESLLFEYIGDPILMECVFGIFLYLLLEKINIENIKINSFFAVLSFILLYFYMWWDGLADIIETRYIRLGISAFVFVFLFIIYFANQKLPDYLIKLGDISYSVYIAEYFTTKAFKILISYITIVPLKYILLIPLIIVTFVAGDVSYRLIEKRLTSCFMQVLKSSG